MELNYNGSGKVFFNENEYDCDLYVNRELGGIHLKINIYESIASFLDLPLKFKYLSGELSTGFKFSVLKCKRTGLKSDVSGGLSTFSYVCKYLVEGENEKNYSDFTFNSMTFKIPGLVQWGNTTAYCVDENWKLFENKVEDREIYKNQNFTVLYRLVSDFLPSHERELIRDKIEIKQFAVIAIKSNKESTLEEFFDLFENIKSLIEFSILEKIDTYEVKAYSSRYYNTAGEHKVPRKINVLCNNVHQIKELKTRNYHDSRNWFNLDELINNKCIDKFINSYSLFEPLIDLYLEIIYTMNISSVRVFLNLVQAIETYHSRFITNNLEEYKKRIEEIILIRRPDEWKENDRKFLLSNTKKFITLENRIADLITAEFEVRFGTGDIEYNDFPKVIANTRNYYIHYNESLKIKNRILSLEEIPIYSRALFVILEYHIYKEMGFTESQLLRKKLYERWGNISDSLSIIKANNEKYDY